MIPTPLPTIPEQVPHYTLEPDGSWRVNMDALRKMVIQVATPCYGRGCSDLFLQSYSRFQSDCQKDGITCSLITVGNESMVTRARNTINAIHLSTPNPSHPHRATHKLWLDADQSFRTQDIYSMLAMNLYVVGGAVPMKTIQWKQVCENVLKQANAVMKKEQTAIHLAEVESSGLIYAIHPILGRPPLRTNGAVEVSRIGTGALLIQREAEERLVKHFPERYLDNPDNPAIMDGYYNFYDSSVRDHTYLSEDYTWCNLWREIGGAIWLFESGCFGHLGSYEFKGRGVKVESP